MTSDNDTTYDAADNSARCYTEAIGAIRLAGVKAGRFLPIAGRPDEIRASPLVEDVRQVGPATLYLGDSTRIVPLLAEQGAWIDACVTDPPYELGFMGKGWDSSGVAAAWETWGGVRIALKPGAHLVAFAGSRTYHRIAKAIDDAGFEVRDQLMWIYGSGFPKSLDVAKQIDKVDTLGPRRDRALRFTAWMRSTGITSRTINRVTASSMASQYLTDGEQPEVATREMFELMRPHLPEVPEWIEGLVDARTVESENLKKRPVLGTHDKEAHAAVWRAQYQDDHVAPVGKITAAFSDDARRWEGWGTALKPSHEPVCFARKPLSEATVAANVLRWATGAINVDGARVEGRFESGWSKSGSPASENRALSGPNTEWAPAPDNPAGRWPANVLHDGSLEVLEAFPPSARDAIRFFYAAKAGREEREEGLSGSRAVAGAGVGALRDGTRTGNARANFHPTVKPVDLMRWLVRLVTPPGGVVLDPFMGSGTTGIAAVREGCRFVGVEQSPEYFEIAAARIAHAQRQTEREPDLVREITAAVRKVRPGGQGDLF